MTVLGYKQIRPSNFLSDIQITQFHGDLQGQSGPGFSWLAFDEDKESPTRPVSSSSNFTFTEADINRVWLYTPTHDDAKDSIQHYALQHAVLVLDHVLL